MSPPVPPSDSHRVNPPPYQYHNINSVTRPGSRRRTSNGSLVGPNNHHHLSNTQQLGYGGNTKYQGINPKQISNDYRTVHYNMTSQSPLISRLSHSILSLPISITANCAGKMAQYLSVALQAVLGPMDLPNGMEICIVKVEEGVLEQQSQYNSNSFSSRSPKYPKFQNQISTQQVPQSQNQTYNQTTMIDNHIIGNPQTGDHNINCQQYHSNTAGSNNNSDCGANGDSSDFHSMPEGLMEMETEYQKQQAGEALGVKTPQKSQTPSQTAPMASGRVVQTPNKSVVIKGPSSSTSNGGTSTPTTSRHRQYQKHHHHNHHSNRNSNNSFLSQSFLKKQFKRYTNNQESQDAQQNFDSEQTDSNITEIYLAFHTSWIIRLRKVTHTSSTSTNLSSAYTVTVSSLHSDIIAALKSRKLTPKVLQTHLAPLVERASSRALLRLQCIRTEPEYKRIHDALLREEKEVREIKKEVKEFQEGNNVNSSGNSSSRVSQQSSTKTLIKSESRKLSENYGTMKKGLISMQIKNTNNTIFDQEYEDLDDADNDEDDQIIIQSSISNQDLSEVTQQAQNHQNQLLLINSELCQRAAIAAEWRCYLSDQSKNSQAVRMKTGNHTSNQNLKQTLQSPMSTIQMSPMSTNLNQNQSLPALQNGSVDCNNSHGFNNRSGPTHLIKIGNMMVPSEGQYLSNDQQQNQCHDHLNYIDYQYQNQYNNDIVRPRHQYSSLLGLSLNNSRLFHPSTYFHLATSLTRTTLRTTIINPTRLSWKIGTTSASASFSAAAAVGCLLAHDTTRLIDYTAEHATRIACNIATLPISVAYNTYANFVLLCSENNSETSEYENHHDSDDDHADYNSFNNNYQNQQQYQGQAAYQHHNDYYNNSGRYSQDWGQFIDPHDSQYTGSYSGGVNINRRQQQKSNNNKILRKQHIPLSVVIMQSSRLFLRTIRHLIRLWYIAIRQAFKASYSVVRISTSAGFQGVQKGSYLSQIALTECGSAMKSALMGSVNLGHWMLDEVYGSDRSDKKKGQSYRRGGQQQQYNSQNNYNSNIQVQQQQNSWYYNHNDSNSSQYQDLDFSSQQQLYQTPEQERYYKDEWSRYYRNNDKAQGKGGKWQSSFNKGNTKNYNSSNKGGTGSKSPVLKYLDQKNQQHKSQSQSNNNTLNTQEEAVWGFWQRRWGIESPGPKTIFNNLNVNESEDNNDSCGTQTEPGPLSDYSDCDINDNFEIQELSNESQYEQFHTPMQTINHINGTISTPLYYQQQQQLQQYSTPLSSPQKSTSQQLNQLTMTPQSPSKSNLLTRAATGALSMAASILNYTTSKIDSIVPPLDVLPVGTMVIMVKDGGNLGRQQLNHNDMTNTNRLSLSQSQQQYSTAAVANVSALCNTNSRMNNLNLSNSEVETVNDLNHLNSKLETTSSQAASQSQTEKSNVKQSSSDSDNLGKKWSVSVRVNSYQGTSSGTFGSISSSFRMEQQLVADILAQEFLEICGIFEEKIREQNGISSKKWLEQRSHKIMIERQQDSGDLASITILLNLHFVKCLDISHSDNDTYIELQEQLVYDFPSYSALQRYDFPSYSMLQSSL